MPIHGLTTEETDVNRLATLGLAILLASPLSALAQDMRRTAPGNLPIRIATVPARSSNVPRPARPNVGRLASNRTYQDPVMDGSETIVESEGYADQGVIYDEGGVYEEGIYEGGAHEGPYYAGESHHGHCESCGDTGCDSCQSSGFDAKSGFASNAFDLCSPGSRPSNRQLVIRLPSHGWVSVDYLGWFASGMGMPPLVTTSPVGTSQANAGVLPSGTVLYGGNHNAFTDAMNGTRVRVGLWSTIYPTIGAEGEYFGFGQQTESFNQTSTGTPILTRPFYNNVTGLQDSELVAFPNQLSGRIQVEATSQLTAAAVRFRKILCCSTKAACSPWDCGPIPSQSRIDATLGWRYLQLQEGLMIQEDLTSTNANNPGSFLITDNFQTYNQFNGAEFGFQWTGRRGFWTLDNILRLGVGVSTQQLTITGSTQSPKGSSTTANGGLLAQPGRNIGSLSREELGVVPEVGINIGYQLTQRLKLNFGYTGIYWSNVLRPGDQIDNTVNPNLLPPALATNAFNGQPFAVRETDYWVQGLNVGGEFHW